MVTLLQLGFVFVFVGMILLFMGSSFATTKGEQGHIKTAGGIFIGPFPLFGFASDNKMFYSLLVVVAVLSLLFFFMRRL